MKRLGDKFLKKNVNEIIKSRGMNQRKFAELLGVKEYTLSRWLSGKRSIQNEETIDEMCKVLDLKYEDLIYEYTPSFDYLDPGEEWRELVLPNCEGMYFVSNKGRVWSVAKDKEIKQSLNKRGYSRVCLEINRQTKEFKVHRLVALTFIPNIRNVREVNHKDGNKQNNNVCNLEWTTSQENVRHAFDNGLHSNTRSVRVIESGEIFKTIKDFKDSYDCKSNSSVQKSLKYGSAVKGVHLEYVL